MNCSFESKVQKPIQVHQNQQKSEKDIAWCVLHAEGFVGSYFLKIDEGAYVIINYESFR